MREIQAYVRPERVERVLRALHDAGVANMAMTYVRSVGSLVDPADVRVSLEAGTAYTEHVKIEFVCAEPDVARLLTLVRERARTGEPGDGIVFVAPVEGTVKIHTGAGGLHALR